MESTWRKYFKVRNKQTHTSDLRKKFLNDYKFIEWLQWLKNNILKKKSIIISSKKKKGQKKFLKYKNRLPDSLRTFSYTVSIYLSIYLYIYISKGCAAWTLFITMFILFTAWKSFISIMHLICKFITESIKRSWKCYTERHSLMRKSSGCFEEWKVSKRIHMSECLRNSIKVMDF